MPYATPRRKTEGQPFFHRIIASRISMTPEPYNPTLAARNRKKSGGKTTSRVIWLDAERYSGMPGVRRRRNSIGRGLRNRTSLERILTDCQVGLGGKGDAKDLDLTAGLTELRLSENSTYCPLRRDELR